MLLLVLSQVSSVDFLNTFANAHWLVRQKTMHRFISFHLCRFKHVLTRHYKRRCELCVKAASPPSYNTAAATAYNVTSLMTSPTTTSRDSSSASSATKRHRLTTSASSETNSSGDSRLYRSDSNYSASQFNAAGLAV